MKKSTTILFVFLLLFSIEFKAQNQKPKTNNNYKNVVLFWDTSLSTQNRNIYLELAFLDAFIKDKSDLSINLVKFSNAVQSEKTYTISKGNWSDLKQDLLQTRYDGATSYKLFVDKKYTAYDAFLIFTDGFQNQTTLRNDILKPMLVVSSNAKTFFSALQLKTGSNNSHFIDFNKTTLADALKSIDIIVDVEKFQKISKTVKKTKAPLTKVTGIITSVDEPLEGVNIKVEGSNSGAVSNSEGKYTIKAKKGDKLTFSYLGFRTYKTTVIQADLDIRLLTNETQLSTVEIQGKKKEVLQDHEMGSKNMRKKGYTVQTITSEDMSPIETNVSQSVQGKFSSVALGQGEDLSRAIIRGYGTIIGNVYPLVVVDGVPLSRADSSGGTGKADLSYLDPDNIAKISVLKGLAATNRWGSQGKSGVILITTKTAILSRQSNKPIDHALVKNNVYKENLNSDNVSKSTYLKDLKTAKTIVEAYDKYLELRSVHGQSVFFYFEVSDYFKQWGNTILVNRILSNVLEINFKNPLLLRALAFKYEADKNNKMAAFVLKRVLRLQPKSAQSYKDMAEIYASQKFLSKAFYLYKGMLEGTVKNVDFQGLNIPLKTEFKRLVQVNKTTLPTAGLTEDYFKKDNINARLYFEWVNPDMEFEVQFVNPQKRFFSWTHSKAFDLQRINDEKAQGFTAEEFLLIDAEKGTWLVNITNLDVNKKENQILKINIFKNYGKPNQTCEIKVIDLKNYTKKATLVKVEI